MNNEEKKQENEITDIKKMNIFEKLSNITSEIERVAKNLTVGEGKSAYKAVGEADILKPVRELEHKYRVYSYPVNREILESTMYDTTNNYGTKTNIFSRIRVTYRFVNIDNTSEYVETISIAEGIDTQDKGSGKAMTYSDKYALMKAYKIMTGEDPDQNPSEEENKESKQTNKSNNTNKNSTPKDRILTDSEAKRLYEVIKGYMPEEKIRQYLLDNYKAENTSQITALQYNEIVHKLKEAK